jgi:hypothetical protein
VRACADLFFSEFAAVRLEHFGLGRPLAVLDFELPPQVAVVAAVRLERRVNRVELARTKEREIGNSKHNEMKLCTSHS